jgi:hypothetical protein
LAAVLFNGGGNSGDCVLSELCFILGRNATDYLCFFIFNLFDNMKDLFPLQACIALGLVNKNFYLIHAFSIHCKASNKVSHFLDCIWRRGYRELLVFAGLWSFTANCERRMLKRKIMGNGFLFIFYFHAASLKQYGKEI